MKRITQILRPATMASLFFVALNASAVPILTSDAVDFLALTGENAKPDNRIQTTISTKRCINP